MNSGQMEGGPARILVVEDSSVFREMQGLLLGQAGYVVSTHAEPQSALEQAAKVRFDLVVIDYELPQMNGQEFMFALRKIQPEIAVIFVSGSLTLELAIQLSGQGVAGIFNKPANPKTLLEKVNETLARNAARDTEARVGSNSPLGGRTSPNSPLYTASSTEPADDQLAFTPRFLPGASEVFREFTHRMWKVRDFRAVLLLQGEPGSPFEAIARDLAGISIFREGPVMVCPAAAFEERKLIEVLAPSLLSHDAGTLIVTGVEGFTAPQQVILNNLISGRDIFLPFARRFRVVLAATARLSERVDAGDFDETLFYKISSLSLAVPSLREMRDDIAPLSYHLLGALGQDRESGVVPELSPEAVAWLQEQEWPGNYDQLCHTLLGAARLAGGRAISATTLAAVRQGSTAESRPATVPRVAPKAGDAGATVRPPFPLASDLARDGATAATPPPVETAPVRAPVAAAAGAERAPAATAIARAPASRLFAKAAPAASRPAAAPSRFRPASASYDFLQRLEASLATADEGAGI
ncbi:MAG: sigma-54-dependent Fis family transcriptional regulator [Verrucomicrobia bacterium]|nr:sigma-54-dependent Fis family transcriptional regulator [Verrucomicrobiota bacterium]